MLVYKTTSNIYRKKYYKGNFIIQGWDEQAPGAVESAGGCSHPPPCPLQVTLLLIGPTHPLTCTSIHISQNADQRDANIKFH